MESGQVEKRLKWLDEQRLKDQESVSRAAERLEAIEDSMKAQTRQLQELSSEVSRLSALSGRINEFSELVTKLRQDFSRQIEGAEERRQEKDSRAEELRRGEQEAISKSLLEVRQELKAIDVLSDAMEARKEEEMRVSRAMDAINKRIDEVANRDEDRSRSMASMEEARRQDARRVTDLQSDHSEIRKRVDTLRGTIDTYEDRTRQIESRITELGSIESDRKEAWNEWAEKQAIRQADFERIWKEYQKRFESFEVQAEDIEERLASYAESYRHLRQLRGEMDGVVERLERRITEISEMQRLAEDRIKQEWASFQADDQKRWNSYRLGHDEQWREHSRIHEKIGNEIQALEENLGLVIRDVSANEEIHRQQVMDLLALLRDWAAEIDRQPADLR